MPVPNRTEQSQGPEGPLDELLRHYLQFVLREESGDLRTRLIEALVERALMTANREHRMTILDVQARIARLTRLPCYPQELIAPALNALALRGDIDASARSRRGARLYRLTAQRHEHLVSSTHRSEDDERALIDAVHDEVLKSHPDLSRDDLEFLGVALREFVAGLLGMFGIHCAHSLVTEGEWAEDADYKTVRELLDACVRGLTQEIQITAKRAFLDVLRDPPTQAKTYLYTAGQAYYMAEVLHLDPELQVLHRKRFEETTVYLDTNLLLAIILPEHATHDAGISLARLCSGAGLQLAYGKRTAEEVEALLEAADHDYAAYPPLDERTAARFAEAVDNPFLRAWLVSLPEHRSSWKQFRVRVSAWRSILDHVGVEFTSDADEVDIPDSRITQLAQVLVKATAPAGPGKRVSGKRRERAKLPRAADHDARMLLALEQLLESDEADPHPFGGRYWLITLDRRLADTARKRLRDPARRQCMLAEEWVQYLAPFTGPDVSQADRAEVFAKLLASRLFLSAGASLSLEDLQPFTDPKVGALTEGLTPEEVCDAIVEARTRATSTGREKESGAATLDAFASLVEARLEARRLQGSLIPRSELDLVVAINAEREAMYEKKLSDRDREVRQLSQDLSEAQRLRQNSRLVRLRRVRDAITGSPVRLARTAARHRWRILSLAFFSAALGLTAAFARGQGLLVVIPIVIGIVASVSPQAAWRNLCAWFGFGKDADD